MIAHRQNEEPGAGPAGPGDMPNEPDDTGFVGKTFEFACASCGASILAQDSWRGCASECPSCGAGLEVPTRASELNGVIARLADSPDDPIVRRKRAWHPKTRIAASVALIACIGVTLHLNRPSAETLTQEQKNDLLDRYKLTRRYVTLTTEVISDMRVRLDYFKGHPSDVSLSMLGPGSPAENLKAYEDEYRSRVQKLGVAKVDMYAYRSMLKKGGCRVDE